MGKTEKKISRRPSHPIRKSETLDAQITGQTMENQGRGSLVRSVMRRFEASFRITHQRNPVPGGGKRKRKRKSTFDDHSASITHRRHWSPSHIRLQDQMIFAAFTPSYHSSSASTLTKISSKNPSKKPCTSSPIPTGDWLSHWSISAKILAAFPTRRRTFS